MSKQRLVSGIQPSGRLHLGNYLGALRNFVELQNSEKYECSFFIADYHSLTSDPDSDDLNNSIIDLAASFMAIGLDPKKSIIFQQSEIPEHGNFTLILNNLVNIGKLDRMTQFKAKAGINIEELDETLELMDKINNIVRKHVELDEFHLNDLKKFLESYKKYKDKNKIPNIDSLADDTIKRIEKEQDFSDNLMKNTELMMNKLKDLNESLINRFSANVGLFYYPILMAADILLYNAEVVPVGEDQKQHLELTRKLASKFNKKFSKYNNLKILKKPEPLMTKTPRVMSLDDPENKMSKSSPKGCIFLDDSPEEIKDKVGSAVTDSDNEVRYDPEEKPAISNLMLIYSSLSDMSTDDIEEEFEGKGYADFKQSLAEVISNYFKDYRDKKDSLMNDKDKVIKALESGNKKARKIAKKNFKEIKQKVGLSIK